MTVIEPPPLLPGPQDRGGESTAGTHAFRGGLWQSAAQVAPYAYTLVISVVAARILGPQQMGRQSYIAFVVMVMPLLLAGGLSTALLRYVGELIGAKRERVLPSLVAWAWPISVVLGGLCALILVVAAALGASPAWAWIFGAVAVFVGVMNGVPGNILIGSQQWRAVAYVVLVTGAASVVATVIVLELGGGISGMLGVAAATAVARYVWTGVLARRLLASVGPEREPLGPLRSEVIRFSLAMSVPMIFTLIVNQRSELVFLERFSSDAQIAIYSIAFSTTAALIAIPRAIGAILTPSVATLVAGGEFERVRRGFSRVLRLGLLFGLPLTGAGLALGPDLLHLVYGHRYAGTGTVLLIVIATLPLTPLFGASSALLIGYGRVRAPIVVSAIAAAVDIGLAALLVPRLDAIGAAVANTSAFFVAAVLLIGSSVRLVKGVQIDWRPVVRIAAVSASAGLLARLVLIAGDGVAILLVAALVELAVLVLGLMAVRAVPEDDATFLVRVAGGRPWVARVLERVSDRALYVSK